MQVQVIGCMHMQGIGKDSGKPYNMARLYVLSPMTGHVTDSMKRVTSGFEAMEIDVLPEAVPEFLLKQYPCKLDLVTDMVPRGGKFQTVITGTVPIKSAS